MVQKKVDSRVRGLIEHGVRKGHRSMFVLVGDHGKDQVENLHKILSRCRVKARPSVLWCYKKELGFSTHRKKRMKEIKKNQARGLHDPEVDDPFDLFISSTNIRWTYYKETDKILGQTFGMCVLQDFEALTPNLLARTIETVEGGGLIVLLLKTVKSLKQLYSITMDVHSRFRTEAHHEIVPRFNERFILSLGDCHGCLVLDDELNILPVSSTVRHLPSSEGIQGLAHEEGDIDASGYSEDPALLRLKESMADTPNAGQLVALTKTIDQANAVLSFLDAISEKTLRSTVTLTSGRGRGKSAAIGLCLAGAIAYGYSNVFVTAPSPENLKTVFEFIIIGLKALKYQEHMDFEVVQETHNPELGKVVVKINLFRSHRQTIQYIHPSDHVKLTQAELVAIDEAAAIPLPTVKKLMGPYLVFLSSTINGYEGTGRSLSLKLIQQLRQQQGASMAAAANSAASAVHGPKSNKGERHIHEDRWRAAAETAASYSSSGSAAGARKLTELSLETPIRYLSGDPIEKWLNNLLCLDITTHSTRLVSVMPAPKDCELYMVNRDALFSYHSLSESFLQRIWALYTSAHYKNTPNDLQLLSDAPAHRLFVLLGPQRSAAAGALPDILCVVQVAFEGFISQKSVQSQISLANKASGDLIPWTVSQQFNDTEFATMSGARIVRIATHADVQKMGYGSRAVDILIKYFQGQVSIGEISEPGVFGGEGGVDDEAAAPHADSSSELGSEEVAPRKKLPPLMTALTDRPGERLHWIGVSFGLTAQLQNFWSRMGFKLCYLRQTTNELTGEYSTILLRELDYEGMAEPPQKGWLQEYLHDYRRRLVSLMSYAFRGLEASLAVTLIDPNRELCVLDSAPAAAAGSGLLGAQPLTVEELLSVHLSHHDMKRLELYARNMVDHHMIIDTIPTLARLSFLGRINGLRLSQLQVVIFLAVGLQNRDVDSVSLELDLPASQVLAFFNKTIRKVSSLLRELVEGQVERGMTSMQTVQRLEKRASGMEALTDSLTADQFEDVSSFAKQKRDLINKTGELNKHALKGNVTTDALAQALEKGHKKQKVVPSTVSIALDTAAGGAGDDAAAREKRRKDKKDRKKDKKRKLEE